MAPYGVPQHPVDSGLLSGLRIRFSHLAMALLHVSAWPYGGLNPLGTFFLEREMRLRILGSLASTEVMLDSHIGRWTTN